MLIISPFNTMAIKYKIEIMPMMIHRYYETKASAIKNAKILGEKYAAELGTSAKVYATITKIEFLGKDIRSTLIDEINF